MIERVSVAVVVRSVCAQIVVRSGLGAVVAKVELLIYDYFSNR